MMWEYSSPVRICFGEDAVYELPGILHRLSCNSAVLFSREISRLSRSAQKAVGDAMPRISRIVSGIGPEPSTDDIDRAVMAMGDAPFDAVIAIGGGSVIDTAKAAMAAAANSCTAAGLLQRPDAFAAYVPLIAIPTTSGTGSEVTRAAAITFHGKKQPVFHDILYPRFALIDPVLTYSCPPAVTASCGMDVLAHACESLMHKRSNPMSAMLAKDAVRLVFRSLETCWREPDNRQARRDMSEASMKAGLAIAASGCTVSHACSYLLSSEFGVPHGEACAFTLDKLIRLCGERDAAFHRTAKELGFKDAFAFADWVKALKQRLGLRDRLEQLGAEPAERERLTDAGWNSPVAKNHCFELTRAEIGRLFG